MPEQVPGEPPSANAETPAAQTPAAETPAAAMPARHDEAAGEARTAPAGAEGYSGADEPVTTPIPVDEPITERVRWTGAASVPGTPPGEQRLDPTLDLPIEEREGAPPPAVDPWAGAAQPWYDLPPEPPALPPGPPPHSQHPQSPQPPRYSAPAAYSGPPYALPQAIPAQRSAPPPQAHRPQALPPQALPPQVPPPLPVVPPGYELRRRRRRWPRRLTLLLLTFGCCCACPAYFLTPIWQQYPASAAAPATAADMTKRDDRAAKRTVRELEAKARAHNWLAEDTFAAVYDGGPGWQVTVYGTTGFRLSPESDLEAELARLAEEFSLDEIREVDAGRPGGYQRCAVGTAQTDDPDLVLCAWADHGSLGVATFSAGSVDQSAETLRILREAIVIRE